MAREKLKEKIAADAFPKPPAVDLELQITNKSKADKRIRVDSDAGRLVLDLQGPGAISAPHGECSRWNFVLAKS